MLRLQQYQTLTHRVFIKAAGFSTIAVTSGFDATGGATFVATSTINQISGFVALGGLKWEDIIVPSDTWTNQIVADATWTNKTSPSTNWTELEKQEAA